MAATRFCTTWKTVFAGLVLACLLPACAERRRVEQKQPIEEAPNVEPPQKNERPHAVGKLKIGMFTLTGNFREFNDDGVAVRELPDATLCMIADGMGGVVNDKVTGQLAYERAFSVLERELKKNLTKETSADETRNVIRRAIVSANNDVIALGHDSNLTICGTTIVLALYREKDGIFIASVGDSRAYHVQGKRIDLLTVDHTLAEALVENKTITREEAKTHPTRNALLKYLGSKDVGDNPEVKHLPFRGGDRLLLCTDGLHSVVPDEQILKQLLHTPDTEANAVALCRLALTFGSRDNVSCILVERND